MDRIRPDVPEGGGARRADVTDGDRAADDTTPALPHPDDAHAPAPDAVGDPVVTVTVTRTGGIAGLRRKWRAEAGEDDADTWIALIGECPWDAVQLQRFAAGADRFMWSIDAQCGPDEQRQAELADSDVQGPWQELIDAVREAASQARRDQPQDLSGRRRPSSASSPE